MGSGRSIGGVGKAVSVTTHQDAVGATLRTEDAPQAQPSISTYEPSSHWVQTHAAREGRGMRNSRSTWAGER
jgi:hypothetical protein